MDGHITQGPTQCDPEKQVNCSAYSSWWGKPLNLLQNHGINCDFVFHDKTIQDFMTVHKGQYLLLSCIGTTLIKGIYMTQIIKYHLIRFWLIGLINK